MNRYPALKKSRSRAASPGGAGSGVYPVRHKPDDRVAGSRAVHQAADPPHRGLFDAGGSGADPAPDELPSGFAAHGPGGKPDHRRGVSGLEQPAHRQQAFHWQLEKTRGGAAVTASWSFPAEAGLFAISSVKSVAVRVCRDRAQRCSVPKKRKGEAAMRADLAVFVPACALLCAVLARSGPRAG